MVDAVLGLLSVCARLDEKGREIDEEGNLIKVDLSDLRTIKANIAPSGKDDKKKKEPENPYLAYSAPDEVRDGPATTTTSSCPRSVC